MANGNGQLGSIFKYMDGILQEEQDPVKEAVRQELDNVGVNFQSGEEPQPPRFDDPAKLTQDLQSVYNAVRPRQEVDSLTEEEQQKQSRLQRRRQRLSPIGLTNQPISQRIQGNPFSVTIGSGLRNLAAAAINRERQRRRFGDQEAVDTAKQRIGNLQTRMDDISKQIAQTDDERELRRLNRKQDRLQRRMSRAQERQQRYSGFEDELTGLEEQEAEAEAAREYNLERQKDRAEFVADNVAKAMQEQQKTRGEIAQENLESFNKYQLQDRLYELKEGLEQAKNNLGSASGRREYASAVNSYARTFLQMADTYQSDIDAARSLIEDRGYQSGKYYYTQEQKEAGQVPEGVPDELIAPPEVDEYSDQMGDPQYLQLQQQIEQARKEKQAVLNQGLKIYENSTVLDENTRVLRPPTEQDKDRVRKMKEHGFDDEQIKSFAKGLGFKYDPSEFSDAGGTETGGDNNQDKPPALQVGPDTTVDDALGFYTKQYDMSEEQFLRNVMQNQNLDTEEEARNYLQQKLEQVRSGQ